MSLTDDETVQKSIQPNGPLCNAQPMAQEKYSVGESERRYLIPWCGEIIAKRNLVPTGG